VFILSSAFTGAAHSIQLPAMVGVECYEKKYDDNNDAEQRWFTKTISSPWIPLGVGWFYVRDPSPSRPKMRVPFKWMGYDRNLLRKTGFFYGV